MLIKSYIYAKGEKKRGSVEEFEGKGRGMVIAS